MTAFSATLKTLSFAALLGACASGHETNTYSAYETNQVRTLERGVVESWREVTVKYPKGGGTAIGVGAGAVTGAVVGGKGSGGLAGAVIGGVVGGLVGSSVDEANSKKRGFEYIVVTTDGRSLSIIDVADYPIPVGAPVILELGAVDRIRIDQSRISTRDSSADTSSDRNNDRRR